MKLCYWVGLIGFALSLSVGPSAGAQDLRKGFVNPPSRARPQVWWHWLNGNVSKEGITADLEAMKQVGIGGGTMASLPFDTEGPAPFMSDAWRGMVTHATREAKRLGMELGFFNCEGWSSSGGPWITPDIAMQMAVWSERRVRGGAPVVLALPKPLTRLNFYRDTAVLAFPTTDGEKQPTLADLAPTVTGAGSVAVDLRPALDGDLSTFVTVPDSADRRPFLQFSFAKPFTAAGIRLVPGPEWTRRDVALQVSDDGQSFRAVGAFAIPGVYLDSGTDWRISSAFPAVSGRFFRIVFDTSDSARMTLAEFNLVGPDPAPPSFTASSTTVDLTDKMDAAGKLTWDAPDGDWTIIRFGYTPIGVTNHPATKYGIGLECDKLSRDALKKHFAGFVDKVIADAGPLAGKTLVYSLIDSYECGEQNWTPALPQEFRRRCGYDLRPWLPVLTGRIVQSPALSQRFRDDFRRTITDLWTENYYGYFAQLLHERGMKSEVEAYGNGSFDDAPWPSRCSGRGW